MCLLFLKIEQTVSRAVWQYHYNEMNVEGDALNNDVNDVCRDFDGNIDKSFVGGDDV